MNMDTLELNDLVPRQFESAALITQLNSPGVEASEGTNQGREIEVSRNTFG